MFDKERAIATWKKSLRKKRALDDGDLLELEGHLRDKIDDLVNRGLSGEAAFGEAEAEFRRSEDLDRDYDSARSRKPRGHSSWPSPRWTPVLLADYLRVALRHFRRKKIYSVINVLGLSVGLACCIVILLYVSNESSYDRYHRDVDRLYRILEYRKVPAGEFCSAGISAMVATVLEDNFGQVEETARIFPVRNVLLEADERRAFEDRVFYSEPAVFPLLSIPLLKGAPSTALGSNDGIVLSERMALKYFGREDPMGKRIAIKDPTWQSLNRKDQAVDYVVRGIAADPPANTHFKYDIFLPLSQFDSTWLLREWHAGPTLTYVKLAPGVSAAAFDEDIERLAYDYVSKELTAWGQTRRYFLQAVKDIHFQRDYMGIAIRGELEPAGNPVYLTIYGLIAMLVLLVGCMNFINLSNARSVYRIKEVGLRKVIGATRRQLMQQFLGEALLVTFIAGLLSLGFVYLLLPLFNRFAETFLSMGQLVEPRVVASFLGLVLVVGLLSGVYPAFVLTAFRADQILRGTRMETRGSLALKVLVVGQFAISIFLATGAVAVSRQLGHMRSGKLGFDKDHKFVLPFRRDKHIRDAVRTMKTEFLRHPNVLGASASSTVPGRPLGSSYLNWTDDKLEKPLRLDFLSCDDDFIPEYQIEMVAGRPFDESLNDENRSFLINEAAVPYLGYDSAEEALGDSLHESVYGRFKTIVGVVKNFHFQGLRNEAEPLFMEVSSSRFDMLTLTLAPKNLPETLRFIESKWDELFPAVPVIGFFLDDEFDRLYRREAQIGELLGTLTGMGLFVACLGLLGLMSFIARHRTKEVGIRKVLGATVPSLVGLLSRRFIIWVMLSNVIAAPLAYLAVARWLQDFAFRIDPGWDLFALAGGAALLCAILPVFFRALLAARADPVDSLRYE